MIEKLGEWYHIVTPEPKHERLEMREASVSKIISTLTRGRKDLMPGAISGLAYRFEPNAEVASAITDAIREQDRTFPTGVEENDEELKVVTAVALGEIMRNPQARKARPLAATLVVSALGIPRDMHSETPHLAKMLEQIRALATQVLQKEADTIREIPPALSINTDALFKEMDEKAQNTSQPIQAQQFWKAVAHGLQQVLNDFNKQLSTLEYTQRVDREELEILWWSYTGWSQSTGEPFARMSAGAAAFYAGRELADICLAPPLPSTQYLLKDIVSRGRGSSSQNLTLEKMMSEWSESVVTDGKQDDPEVSGELAKMYPVVLPISWIVQRLTESRMSAGWTDEFETMTGIKRDVALSPAQWAEQVLWEHITQRVYRT